MANRNSGAFVDATMYNEDTFDIGDVKYSARRSPSNGWLKGDGSAVSRTTYADLFAAIVLDLGAVTVTIASPGVFTLTSHGLVIGNRVYLTTSGALPTGLAANTIYYVVSVPTSSTFTLSATEGGSAINTTGSQSGTHHLHDCPYGLGDGATTFNLPDAPGRTLVAAAGSSGHSSVRARGQNDGVAIGSRSQKHNSTVVDGGHTHTVPTANSGASQFGGGGFDAAQAGSETTGSATTGITVGPGGTLPVDQPANLVMNLFIKYA